jgi:hypothetical protein
MTKPSSQPNGSRASVSSEAAEFLGGQPDEVALFALAQRPTTYRPLTNDEVSNLKAAVAGTLPQSLSGSVCELLKHNSAATEFVMSEQLLSAANRCVEIPTRLSAKILRGAKPAAIGAPRQRYSVFFWSWRYAAVGAAAAALAIAVSFYGLNQPGKLQIAHDLAPSSQGSFGLARTAKNEIALPSRNEPSRLEISKHEPAEIPKNEPALAEIPNFTVAVLDDHEILNAGGTVTRGGVTPNPRVSVAREAREVADQLPNPPKPPLEFVEIDVRKGLLVSFFAADQIGKQAEENAMIARLSGALNVDNARFIFDAAIKPLLTGNLQDTLTLRIYDLTDPANTVLASALHLEGPGKRYFVSM